MLVVVWYSHLPCKLDFWTFSFPIQTLYVKVLKICFFCPNQYRRLFWGVNTWKVLSGDELILKSHTIQMGRVAFCKKNAMLVVLLFTFYLKIGLWPFSVPITKLHVKVFKEWFFGQIKDRRPFLGSQYLKCTFWWWTWSKVSITIGMMSLLC